MLKSDRIVLIDLLLGMYKYRFIAVYFPHAGYSLHDYNCCFDLLRQAILDGQRSGCRCMLGGDFNTVIHKGWRGDRLRELLHETDLDTSNDPDVLDPSEAWTFRSCLGNLRSLDYCFVP